MALGKRLQPSSKTPNSHQRRRSGQPDGWRHGAETSLKTSTPAATPRAAVRPRSTRPATARPRRRRSPRRSRSARPDQRTWSPGATYNPRRRPPHDRPSPGATIAQASSRITVKAPMVAKSAQAGQFVRVLPSRKGELIPLTLADWTPSRHHHARHPGVGASSILINKCSPAKRSKRRGTARPALEASPLRRQEADRLFFCRRRRVAAGLPDRARTPAPRQSRHA